MIQEKLLIIYRCELSLQFLNVVLKFHGRMSSTRSQKFTISIGEFLRSGGQRQRTHANIKDSVVTVLRAAAHQCNTFLCTF